jgi:hypothetical protein
MAHWRRLYDNRFLEVRYEDLVRRTTEEAARISAFCGLPDLAVSGAKLNPGEIGRWVDYVDHLGPLSRVFGSGRD